MQLTKKEMEETQMLVTTPEKWDVVTRKVSAFNVSHHAVVPFPFRTLKFAVTNIVGVLNHRFNDFAAFPFLHTLQQHAVSAEDISDNRMASVQGSDAAVASLVRLLIIDEVHLLNDERGAVIETLVSRTQRQVPPDTMKLLVISHLVANLRGIARLLCFHRRSIT